MTDKEKEIVGRASVPMNIANALRLFFMTIALLLLLLIFFGGKFLGGVAWYETFVQHSYTFHFWDIMLMLICTIARIIFTARYNHIVKNL